METRQSYLELGLELKLKTKFMMQLKAVPYNTLNLVLQKFRHNTEIQKMLFQETKVENNYFKTYVATK